MAEETEQQIQEQLDALSDEQALGDHTPTAAEETPPEPGAEKPKETPLDERSVPYGALREARQELSGLRGELQAERDRVADIERQFREFISQKQAPAEEPLPAFDEAPADHLRARLERLERQEREAAKRGEQTEQQTTEQKRLQDTVSRIQTQEFRFASEHEDYGERAQYVNNLRVKDLVAGGFGLEEAQQAVYQENFEMARRALDRGENPAEIMYARAERLGWTNGKRATNDPAAEKVRQIQKGQKAGSPVSGGGESPENMDLARLAEMSPSDPGYDKAWEKMFGRRVPF